MRKGQIKAPREMCRALGVLPVRSKSVFEKYRGIGTKSVRRGRKAVVRWVRDQRGG
jgi:hypothetical protein